MLGVSTVAEALRAAIKAGMDLALVNPKVDPFVSKILDFKKYRYADMRAHRSADAPDDDPDH
jgi:translation initiation factor IF-3